MRPFLSVTTVTLIFAIAFGSKDYHAWTAHLLRYTQAVVKASFFDDAYHLLLGIRIVSPFHLDDEITVAGNSAARQYLHGRALAGFQVGDDSFQFF